MRPLSVVMLEPHFYEVVEVPLPQDHEVVEALLLDRLIEPLDIGVGVRCPESGLDNLDVGRAKSASTAAVNLECGRGRAS